MFSRQKRENSNMELSSDDRVNLVLWVGELDLNEQQRLALSDICMSCEHRDDESHKKIKVLMMFWRQFRCALRVMIFKFSTSTTVVA